MNKIKYVLVVVAMLLTVGCSVVENYQFGDATKAVLSLKKEYCEATTDKQRNILIEKIRAKKPNYTPVCN